MRFLPLILLLSLGCITTTVARLSPVRYEPRSSEASIPLYSSQLPTCPFEEVAIVKARRETWIVSTGAAVDALRKKARQMGGDALVGVGFGTNSDVTATVIRFQRGDCRQ
jgi:hypothetical protein